jgi:putative oxygen-independent coproporphyrinogen III oxidase
VTGSASAAASLALYVHMPWCVRKCPYCDFNSHQLNSSAPDAAYVDALIRDFDAQLPQVSDRRIDTVFFGGGTPSLFQPEDFSRLLGAFRERITFARDAEVTMEANPGTIERGRFAGYRDAGINRVSLGAQSFAPRALSALGRIHSAEDTRRAVQELRAANLDNFNLDLMYALPGQTQDEALDDVRAACALEPAHISYYHLTLEPGTVFYARPPSLPDEDAAWTMQCAGQELLADAGYVQYEVSAYARPGARCRHNLNYWLFGDYLGIGAGAHGKLSLALPHCILRTVKPKQPREYLSQVRGESSCIRREDLPFEFMLNALRLNEGFTVLDYRERTGLDIDTATVKLAAGEARGLLERRVDGWRPTELGRRFLNDLQGSFLA